jgi:hypothetical protein
VSGFSGGPGALVLATLEQPPAAVMVVLPPRDRKEHSPAAAGGTAAACPAAWLARQLAAGDHTLTGVLFSASSCYTIAAAHPWFVLSVQPALRCPLTVPLCTWPSDDSSDNRITHLIQTFCSESAAVLQFVAAFDQRSASLVQELSLFFVWFHHCSTNLL